MVESSEDFYETFELLRKHCTNSLHLLKQVERGVVIIRSDMTKSSEASLFVEAYETITHSRFKLYNSRNGLNRMHFKREWVCQHSLLTKRSVIPVEKCAAKICIAVKKITKLTKASDGYLKLVPPLQAVIRITVHHNHVLTDFSPSKMLRISREVRESFYEYFRKGIKGVKAKRLHEQNLQKANITALDDATINPRISAIYTLYRKWKQLKENVQLNKVPVSDSGSARRVTDDGRQSLSVSNGSSNLQKIVSSFGTKNADQIGGLEQSGNNSDVKPPVKIKEEVIDVENEDDSQLPIIVSCCSLAPEANNTAVPYQARSLPSSSSSFVMPTKASQPVPLVANNVVPALNSNVVPTSVSILRVEPVNNTQLVVYNKSSNTYKVVKYLKVCSSTSATINSSNQYSSYFPNRIQLPTRVGIQKL